MVKPHPAAILPLAITVSIARDVLAEAGFVPGPGHAGRRGAGRHGRRRAGAPARGADRRLHRLHRVRRVAGGQRPAGRRLHGEGRREHGRCSTPRTTTAGMLANLAFSLSLYSGQMCTTPQDLLIPADGIATDAGRKTVDEFARRPRRGRGEAARRPDAQAVELLGAIVNDGVLSRVDGAGVARDGACVAVPDADPPGVPGRARSVRPRWSGCRRDEPDIWGSECFGPVSFVVTTESTERQPGPGAPDGDRPRRADRGGLLHRREGRRGGPGGRARRRRARCRRTSPAASTSTRPRRTRTCTRPAPTRPRTPRTPTRTSSPAGSG